MMKEWREINNVTLGIDCIFCDTRKNNHRSGEDGHRRQKIQEQREGERKTEVYIVIIIYMYVQHRA